MMTPAERVAAIKTQVEKRPVGSALPALVAHDDFPFLLAQLELARASVLNANDPNRMVCVIVLAEDLRARTEEREGMVFWDNGLYVVTRTVDGNGVFVAALLIDDAGGTDYEIDFDYEYVLAREDSV